MQPAFLAAASAVLSFLCFFHHTARLHEHKEGLSRCRRSRVLHLRYLLERAVISSSSSKRQIPSASPSAVRSIASTSFWQLYPASGLKHPTCGLAISFLETPLVAVPERHRSVLHTIVQAALESLAKLVEQRKDAESQESRRCQTLCLFGSRHTECQRDRQRGLQTQTKNQPGVLTVQNKVRLLSCMVT